MIRLTDKQIAEYFRRSYKTVDGLWFMRTEAKHGFDAALEIDDAVWSVMPKVQARKLKALSGLESGLEALFECFTTRLALEGFDFVAEKDPDGDGFEVVIHGCPWYDLLVKADRQHLAGTVSERICNTEYAGWAAEFGPGISFISGDQICKGCGACVLRFERTAATAPT
jgi:hypothetical protein